MSPLAITAIVLGAVWLGVLTLVGMLIIRQIALLTARVEHLAARPSTPVQYYDPMADGPELHVQLPDTVAAALPDVFKGRVTVALLSATCTPCRDIAEQLSHRDIGDEFGRIIALVPGRAELADAVVELLPDHFRVVRDPTASAVAGAMDIRRVPFALQVDDGVVIAKAPPLDTADDLLAFITTYITEGTGAPSDMISSERAATGGVVMPLTVNAERN